MSVAPSIVVDIEASDISSQLNSTVFCVFLLGIYTVIYFGTIYMYFTKNSSKRHLVPVIVTILYLSYIAGAATQWYAAKWAFVDNGDTRQSVFVSAVLASPPWYFIAMNTSNCITFVAADGILIWRCFHVWNHSLRVISVSLFLFFAETALFLAEISFNARYANSNITPAIDVTINALIASAYFMSFATTLVTTVLIAYRIYSASNIEMASSRRFKHVVDIVVQSGAVYALSQLVAAVAGVLPDSDVVHTRNIALEDYGQVLNFAIAGISSTVMVARVALLSADIAYPATSVHLSGLQFYTRSSHPTVNIEAIEVAHSDVGDNQILSSKEQAVEDKVR